MVLGAADPPVRILERDVLPTRRHCWAMEDLVLEVHLSHAHGEVKWYKDGEKLQDTGRVRLEEDGARRSLVILGATGRDAGEYLCDTGDDSIIFFVTVEGEWEVPAGRASRVRTEVGPWLLPGWCRAGLGGNGYEEAGGGDTGSGCTHTDALWKPLRCLAAASGGPGRSGHYSIQHRLLLMW